jgi:hypothetical protein
LPGVSAGIVTFYAVQARAPVPASHCVELPTLPGVSAGIVTFYAVQARAPVPASHCVDVSVQHHQAQLRSTKLEAK